MITKLSSVTVYGDNQDEALNFYTEKLGLHKINDVQIPNGMRWLAVAPSKDSETVILAEILDDASLIRLLALNHTDALSVLYDRYGRLVYSIALNAIGDQAVAEEIVQDVFTRVWEKANTYDARIAKVSTWLINITRNRSIDELRRGKIRPEKTSVSWADLSQRDNPQSPGPEEKMELSWRQSSLREALETISPNQREVLVLAYFKGYSQSEIAELIGVPLGTVKNRIRLAMQKLRLVLSQTMMEESQLIPH